MPVESDIYSTKVRAVMVAEGDTMDVSMCAVCAGTSHDDLGGAVDPTLQKVYIPVLPICTTMCKSEPGSEVTYCWPLPSEWPGN